jgi:hypothetical protein
MATESKLHPDVGAPLSHPDTAVGVCAGAIRCYKYSPQDALPTGSAYYERSAVTLLFNENYVNPGGTIGAFVDPTIDPFACK